jgi:hypothetical protein
MNSLTFAAVMAVGTIAWAGGPTTAPVQNTAPAKKATAAVVRKAPATPVAASATAKKPVTKTATATAKRTVKTVPVVRASWRNRQAAPTADRYREIQQALAARGYLSTEEANGAWGASSMDALKKFQAEQALETTGKIDSLSLIALGLGPRHDSVAPRVAEGNFQPESGRN